MKSVEEFADQVGVSGRRVRVWLADGRIPGATQIGRTWVIPPNSKRPDPIPPGRKPKR